MSVLILVVPVLILIFVMRVAVFVFVVLITILVVPLALMIFVVVMSFVVAILVFVMFVAIFVFVVFVTILVVTLALVVFVVVIMPTAEFRERDRIDPIRQLHYRLRTLRRVANQVVQPRLLETQSHNEYDVRVRDIGDIACAGLEVMRVRLAWNQ